MPSGEVFTAPVDGTAEGRIRYTVPSSPGGVEVEGIELEFREGVVVAASAGRGEEYLKATLATDEGASPAGRDRHRHQLRHRPRRRRDPLRREDRRHRPSRRRPRLPGERRHQRVGGALGHDLRPARVRPPLRRRRDDPRERPLHVGRAARPGFGRRRCSRPRVTPLRHGLGRAGEGVAGNTGGNRPPRPRRNGSWHEFSPDTWVSRATSSSGEASTSAHDQPHLPPVQAMPCAATARPAHATGAC